MITITLQKIKDKHPCEDSWRKVLKANKDRDFNEEFSLVSILDSNDLGDTLWCLRCLPDFDNLWRKLNVWCARQVEHLLTDERSKRALDVAWRYSEGEATKEELDAARDAAEAAAEAARDAKWAAAWAAAGAAKWAAKWAAARDAARDAARAARAARAAAWAARAAAGDAVWDAVWAAAWAAVGAAAEAARAAAGDTPGDTAEAAVGDAAWDAARAAQERKLRQILEAGRWVD